MDIIKIKLMNPQPPYWVSLFEWIKENTILFTGFALAWKGIDKVFKYFSEARDAELRKIVQDEMHPLGKAIDELREAIWALKSK